MKNPLHVAYVLNSPGGGATQGIVEMLRLLPRAQYRPFIVVPSKPSVRQQKVFEDLCVEFQVIPMVWWNKKIGLPWWKRFLIAGRTQLQTGLHLLPIRRLQQRFQEWRIDLVHTGSAMTLDGALAARQARLPHVWHIKEYIGSSGLTRFWLPDPWLSATFQRLSAKIIVMSDFIGSFFAADHLFGRRSEAATVACVPDGVRWQDFVEDDVAERASELRRSLGLETRHQLIGMVASLTAAWKQHELFIDMAALLKENYPLARFAAFGPEPRNTGSWLYNSSWNHYQRLRQQVRDHDLDEQFLWPGFCEDIPAMMGALDILVHPCNVEPFGRIAIEAMAAGKPVVGPQTGGIAETVSHEKTGLLARPRSPDAFSQATARLLDDPNLRRQFGLSGQRRARTHYSLERHVDQISAVYDSVLQMGHGRKSRPY